MFFNLIDLFLIFVFLFFTADPKFSAPIANVTVAVGREAILTCVVHDLGAYKVRIYYLITNYRCPLPPALTLN